MSELKTKSYYGIAAVILTLIGGSLILVNGILFLVWSLNWSAAGWPMMHEEMMMGNMMSGRSEWMSGSHFWNNMMSGFSVASIASGAIVVISGLMIFRKPSEAQMWGIIALVFSIFGILGMGGFVIGTVLGTLGGILALFLKK